MTYETISALFTFALVSSITPGPNNIMLMSSGTNFGFRRTTPHMLGVNIGFTVMLILVGIGLSQLFILYPIANQVLQVFSAIYLLYLAYKIATSAPIKGEAIKASKPFTFIEAALFQWVNPKAWTMSMTAISLYSPSGQMKDVMTVALVFWAANIPSIGTWVVLGQQIRRLLVNHMNLKIFNITMAVMLVGTLYFVLVPN